MSDPFSHLREHDRERVRFKMATQYVVESRVVSNNANDAESIKKAGYRDEREYWNAAMSRPMKALSFAHFLTSFHLELRDGRSNQDILYLVVKRALSDALEMGQPWIIRDPKAPDGAPDDLARLRVDPRAAAEWLLSLPTERGLVPPGLRSFLESSERHDARAQTIQPSRKALSRDKENDLRAFLVSGRHANERDAHIAAENHFNRKIDRERIRTIRRDNELLGAPGARRKSRV